MPLMPILISDFKSIYDPVVDEMLASGIISPPLEDDGDDDDVTSPRNAR
jgi:hypothetical protein